MSHSPQSSSRRYGTSRSRRFCGALLAALTVGSLAVAGSAPVAAVPTPAGSPGTISTMAGVTRNFALGGYGPENVLATESQFLNPRGLAVAPNGEVYIADTLNHRVRRLDGDGVVHLVAGTGWAGDATGDGGPAVAATLNEPHDVAVDSLGNVYISDRRNCVVRRVDPSGIITRFAGTGQKLPGSSACVTTAGTPDGDALHISLDHPTALDMQHSGGTDTLWIADTGNHQIRKIEVVRNGAPVPVPQNIRVAGGNTGRHYAEGSGQDALDAEFRHPQGLWVDHAGHVYVSDSGNNLLRKIAMPAPGSSIRRVTTIAGNVAAAGAAADDAEDLAGDSDGDGGLAVTAHLDGPRGVAGDNHGHLYVAEQHGARIRRINLSTGKIRTIAGDGTVLEQRPNGGSLLIKGENGPALQTQFALPADIVLNPADGSLWIADSRHNRVRAVADAAAAPGANIPTGGSTTPPPAPTFPGAPTAVVATAGNRSASVTWSAPDDGGAPIIAYTVRSSAGHIASVNGTTLSATMTGLANGTTYTFTVEAANSVGRSSVSAPSNPVTPAGLPAVPPPPPGPPPTGPTTPAAPATPTTPGNDDPGAGPATTPGTTTGTLARAGYWMVGADGVVHAFGDAEHHGNAATASAVDLEPTPSGNGYWIVDEEGRVFASGDAVGRGDVDRSQLTPGEKVTSLSATGEGHGYWIFTSRGRVLTFGDAAHLGDVSTLTLAGPVLDSIVTPSGGGYYMVASDGGIFAFGDAQFYGSMGGHRLNAPVQSLVPDSDGAGYWLVASDGGIFAFRAEFKGSMGAARLNRPITGMVRAGSGYLMVGEDGGIFDFSGDPDSFQGSLGANPPARPISAVAVLESR